MAWPEIEANPRSKDGRQGLDHDGRCYLVPHGNGQCLRRPAGCNVYGPRQSPHGEAGVVAIFSDRLRLGGAPVVYGDGRQTRDYIYVTDVANAFVLACEGGQASTFNLGWGRESSVLDLLKVLQRVALAPVEPSFEPLRAGELSRSALDSTRLRSTLGWEPRVGLEEGLALTYEYYDAGAETVDAADPV
jgi:UDP-glucose 4-epimerase